MICRNLLHVILAALMFAGCAGNKGMNDKELRAEFLNPGLKHRMNVNRHHVPQTDEGQDELIRFLIDNGYRGMATNADGRNYMKSDEELALFRKMVYKAREKGLDLWLYDENGYPSGMAHTYILDEHPEWEVEGLFFADTLVKGGQSIVVPILRGTPVVTKAVPIIRGIKSYEYAVDVHFPTREGMIRWDVPEGEWILVQITHDALFEGFQACEGKGGGATPRYTSLLMPEVTERFIELTHKRYAAAFDEKLGDIFTSTFTDEPSTMAMPYHNLGCGVFPWKENVSREFRDRYGYTLEENLLPMTLDEGPDGEKLRFQYFSIISDFMSGHFFRQIRDYCKTQDLRSGGHLLVEESMMAQVPLYGSIMACFREMDVPGIDVLTGLPSIARRYLYSARLASSVGELNGTDKVMCESCPIAEFPLYDGKEAPTVEVRGTLNRQMLGGVTDFNNYLKLMHEDPAGRTRFNEYIARVQMMIAGGVRASQIAVYYPVETMWTKYRPLPTALSSWDNMKGGDPAAQRVQSLFDGVSDCLYDNGWEFSYIDCRGVEESRVEKGELVHGDLRWKVVVLPGVETISEEALARLAEFVAQGGKVVSVGGEPVNSFTDFPSDKIAQEFARMKDTGNGAGAASVFIEKDLDKIRLNALLDGVLDRDILMDRHDGVLHTHRRIGGRDIYFVVNDTENPMGLHIEFPAAKKMELWNPHTGEVASIGSDADLALGPFESMIVRQIK